MSEAYAFSDKEVQIPAMDKLILVATIQLEVGCPRSGVSTPKAKQLH